MFARTCGFDSLSGHHNEYMDSTIEKQEDGTIVLNITIPSKTVKDAAGIVLEEVVKKRKCSGF